MGIIELDIIILIFLSQNTNSREDKEGHKVEGQVDIYTYWGLFQVFFSFTEVSRVLPLSYTIVITYCFTKSLLID
jgi:hypothetical protein